MRSAIQARKSLPNEPLTHLLRAQAAQLAGDRTTARRIFEAMLASPDTEQLGLRGLFLEAQREGEIDAGRHFTERAVALNPKLAWAIDALFDLQCSQSDWAGALDTVATARKHGHIERPKADRRRAVLLAAQAQAAEEIRSRARADARARSARARPRSRAGSGHRRAPARLAREHATRRQGAAADLEPLAASRSRDRLRLRPHRRQPARPARPHQAARRAQPQLHEGPIAVANAAIEARQYDEARTALEPLLHERLTQRVATLMARIESELGDKGRVREWLARAVHAPRDPAWTADGIATDRWSPISPVTRALDAFQWRAPVKSVDHQDAELLASKAEELAALGVDTTTRPSPKRRARHPPTKRDSGAETVEPVDHDDDDVRLRLRPRTANRRSSARRDPGRTDEGPTQAAARHCRGTCDPKAKPAPRAVAPRLAPRRRPARTRRTGKRASSSRRPLPTIRDRRRPRTIRPCRCGRSAPEARSQIYRARSRASRLAFGRGWRYPSAPKPQ